MTWKLCLSLFSVCTEDYFTWSMHDSFGGDYAIQRVWARRGHGNLFNLYSKWSHSARNYLRDCDLWRVFASQVLPTCFDHLEDLEMSTNSQSKPLLWGGSTAKIHESMPQGTKCFQNLILIYQRMSSFFWFRWANLGICGHCEWGCDVLAKHMHKKPGQNRLFDWLRSFPLSRVHSFGCVPEPGPTLIHSQDGMTFGSVKKR